MADTTETWLYRAKDLIAIPNRDAIVPFAISIFSTIYGPQSIQLSTLNHRIEGCSKVKNTFFSLADLQRQEAFNAIQSAIIEIESAHPKTQVQKDRNLVGGMICNEQAGES